MQMLILAQFSFGLFNRKMVNIIQYSIMKIKISLIFKHLRSKYTSEICPKIGGLDGKTDLPGVACTDS